MTPKGEPVPTCPECSRPLKRMGDGQRGKPGYWACHICCLAWPSDDPKISSQLSR